MTLPRLEARYRKQGSLAAGWSVSDNQRWIRGFVAAIAKNGSPTATNINPSNKKIGLDCDEGAHPSLGTASGPERRKRRSGNETTARWSQACFLAPSHVVVACT